MNPKRLACVTALCILALAACSGGPPPLPGSATPAPAAAPGAVMLTVNFPVNSWRIEQASQPTLDALAIAMNGPELARAAFRIEGHTDVSGRLPRNMTLSELRAAAVKDYLVSRGVEASRLTGHGYGPLRLIHGVPPRDPRHRRVEVVRVQ